MSNKNKNLLGVVYSTDKNFEYEEDAAAEKTSLQNSKQQLRVRIEKHHRGGKVVTVVDGFNGNEKDMEALCKTLKTKCGTGGTVKDGLILIQGEMKERIVKLLIELGYRAK
ncbi:MAG: translation initiation factor [Chitinophagales bacterium]|nr:translation initiation factor [Chitinophagales bacterium]